MNVAILLAAGSGNRMQGSTTDKILHPLLNQPTFSYSLAAFAQSQVIDHLTVVYRDAPQKEQLAAALAKSSATHLPANWVAGGRERQDSVSNALHSLPENCKHVFIHDCARPCITSEAIQQLATALETNGSAVLAHPVVDTIKRIPDPKQTKPTPLEDLQRDRLWAMETPQAFDFKQILKAYQQAQQTGTQLTDDTAAAAAMGLKIALVANKTPNPKLTTPTDLLYIEAILKART